MAELTLYGSVDVTRSWWVAWMCRELGIEYQNPQSEGFLDPFWKTPEYLAINPSGLMPSIRDGEFVLWESMRSTFTSQRNTGVVVFARRRWRARHWPGSGVSGP